MTNQAVRREKPARSPGTPYIVLVGLDLSEPGGRAWRFAFELAALRGDESEVHAVIVGDRAMAPRVRDLPTPGVEIGAQPRPEEAQRLPPLRVLQHRSASGQARLMAMHFRTGRADRAVVQLARDIGADVIVVATEPTTRLQRLFGGSTADRIARDAPCPVVVVRPKTNDDDPGLCEYGVEPSPPAPSPLRGEGEKDADFEISPLPEGERGRG